ncbi:MAG: tRNA (5-methylaminomethyl-2-thiouridylate)-methyltransferase [Coxiellaceae bacterium]|jgi:tRNA U34 2-thiouridine synthase MnmA/TrmU|nr:tRNA (5-methylaminomethyl-2-thiouridylate)-methyltransferase [Coxiellaceae bacterium]
MHKVLSLISGGLDSFLATKLILMQGVYVEGINFFTGFSGDHEYCFDHSTKGSHGARWVCDQLGIKLHVVNVVDLFKPILLQPKYGYGANLNPCLDCKLFMIGEAKTWMEKCGFDFLISGEVLGQRPKSQRKDTLPFASKITSDLIVRPLSAKLLPPTLPERAGWINRELLYSISGRGRKFQLNLAQKFGFKKIPQPSGGCLLTDSGFCRRLQDLWDHHLDHDYDLNDILLLRLGRHLRVNSKLKVVVGRDEGENNFLENFSSKYTLLQPINFPGATVLVDGKVDQSNSNLLACLSAYFSKGRNASEVKVLVRYPQDLAQNVLVVSATPNEVLSKWYI